MKITTMMLLNIFLISNTFAMEVELQTIKHNKNIDQDEWIDLHNKTPYMLVVNIKGHSNSKIVKPHHSLSIKQTELVSLVLMNRATSERRKLPILTPGSYTLSGKIFEDIDVYEDIGWQENFQEGVSGQNEENSVFYHSIPF